jgi:hypothetical protein
VGAFLFLLRGVGLGGVTGEWGVKLHLSFHLESKFLFSMECGD